MLRPTLRFLGFATVVTFLTGASAWAQQLEPTKISAALTSDVRDVEVQKQLIALGVLDATAGRASTDDLAEAVAWFRKACPPSALTGQFELIAQERVCGSS